MADLNAEFPRVLMISDEGPQTGTAGGLILHRLLAGHPPDRLHVIARYVPTLGDPLPGVAYRPLRTPWSRFEKSRFNRLKRSLRAVGLVPPVATAEIERLAEGFAPDVVLCVMQHAAYYDTAWQYARRRGRPLVVMVHDVNDDFEPVLPWSEAAVRRRDAAFYQFARRRLCVSPEMEAHCRERYGVPGTVLYPNRSADLGPVPFDRAAALRTPGRLTVGFAGNLGYGYGRELCRLLPALRASGTRIVIYGHPPGSDCAALRDAADVVELRGFQPSAMAWAGLQRDCDCVWLPYPVDAAEFERLYRTHFPSKLAEYLALGLPVLVTGPNYATGLRWARRHPRAVASEVAPTVEQMTRQLQRLAADAALRQELARAGWDAGQADFDPHRIVREFQEQLRAAAREGGRA